MPGAVRRASVQAEVQGRDLRERGARRGPITSGSPMKKAPSRVRLSPSRTRQIDPMAVGRALGAEVASGTPGCPRHPVSFDRKCIDYRCQKNWKPEGAPTPDEQLARWVEGDAVCPNTNHECCPDFGCCRPKLLWPEDKRRKFAAASQGEREKMMMGALGAVIADVGTAETPIRAYVTRGVPTDHE